MIASSPSRASQIKAIIDPIPCAIFVAEVDQEGLAHMVAVNRYFETRCGWSQEQAESQVLKDLLFGGLGGECLEDLRRCLSLKSDIETLDEIISPKGRGWARISLSPYATDEDRRLVMGSVNFVHQPVEIMDSASQETLEIHAEYEDPSCVAITGSGKIISCNSAFARALARPAEEVEGADFLQFVVPEDQTRCEAFLKAIDVPENSEDLAESDFSVTSASGEAQKLLWRARYCRSEEGELLGVDLTGLRNVHRWEIEDALKRSEERWRSLVEGSLQGICVHRAYKPVFVNEAFATIYGFDSIEEAMAYPDMLRLVEEKGREKAIRIWQRCQQDPNTKVVTEAINLTKSGKSIWVQLMIQSVDWMGEPAQQVTVVDLSERKAFERELMESKDLLEEQAAALVRLASDLDSARKEAEHHSRAAEAANHAKSKFLATMSHELRTPLNAILGFSEIIAREAFGASGVKQYPEYAADIHSSGTHLLELINDILDLAKIEAGKLDINPSPIYLPDILESCLRLSRVKAAEEGLSLKLFIESGSEMLEADERAVKQIVFNLISNAIKFTPTGGTINLEAVSALQGTKIIVSDEGIGIPTDQLHRVVRPFEQINNNYNREAGGTGLGLALVNALVDLHGGELSISSEEGKGTKVEVYFPNHIAEQRADKQEPSDTLPSSIAKSA